MQSGTQPYVRTSRIPSVPSDKIATVVAQTRQIVHASSHMVQDTHNAYQIMRLTAHTTPYHTPDTHTHTKKNGVASTMATITSPGRKRNPWLILQSILGRRQTRHSKQSPTSVPPPPAMCLTGLPGLPACRPLLDMASRGDKNKNKNKIVGMNVGTSIQVAQLTTVVSSASILSRQANERLHYNTTRSKTTAIYVTRRMLYTRGRGRRTVRAPAASFPRAPPLGRALYIHTSHPQNGQSCQEKRTPTKNLKKKRTMRKIPCPRSKTKKKKKNGKHKATLFIA